MYGLNIPFQGNKQISNADIESSRSKTTTRFEIEQPESKELVELVQSVKLSGVIEPIIVRPEGRKEYKVIAGNRRLRSAKIAKLAYIPAIVRDANDLESRRLVFIENVIRKNLTAMQMSKGLAAMYKDVGISPEIAIKKVHRIKYVTKSDKRSDLQADPTEEFMHAQQAIIRERENNRGKEDKV